MENDVIAAKFQLRKMKRILWMGGGNGCTTM